MAARASWFLYVFLAPCASMSSTSLLVKWNHTQKEQIFFDQSVMLYTAYNDIRILVHKPFIPSPAHHPDPPGSINSLAICTEAARTIIDVMHTQCKCCCLLSFLTPVLSRTWLSSWTEHSDVFIQRCPDSSPPSLARIHNGKNRRRDGVCANKHQNTANIWTRMADGGTTLVTSLLTIPQTTNLPIVTFSNSLLWVGRESFQLKRLHWNDLANSSRTSPHSHILWLKISTKCSIILFLMTISMQSNRRLVPFSPGSRLLRHSSISLVRFLSIISASRSVWIFSISSTLC